MSIRLHIFSSLFFHPDIFFSLDLSEEELQLVRDTCDVALSLTESKKEIFEYVESRMAFIAPNLTAIIGASVAAKMMGAAGGLTNLSKMPANHIALLGQEKKTLSGFSQKSTLPHTGFVYYSDVVQEVTPVKIDFRICI